MTALITFLTFLLVLMILGGGAWGGWRMHQRLRFLDAEYRRLLLLSVEEHKQFESALDQLKVQVGETEARVVSGPQRPAQSVNYTQRSQMLRMVRRGDPAEQIASNLCVPLSHVRLLMKLPGITRPKDKAQTVGQLR